MAISDIAFLPPPPFFLSKHDNGRLLGKQVLVFRVSVPFHLQVNFCRATGPVGRCLGRHIFKATTCGCSYLRLCMDEIFLETLCLRELCGASEYILIMFI